MGTRHMLQETVRQTSVLLENMQNKLTVVEDMCDTLLKIRSMLEDKEDLEEVEPIILDSTTMKKKLVTAIDTVCKVLMEVREVGSLVELTLERVDGELSLERVEGEEGEVLGEGEIPQSLRLELFTWPRKRAELDLARIERLYSAVNTVNQIF